MKRNVIASTANNFSSGGVSLSTALTRWRHRLGYLSAFATLPALLASNPGDAIADNIDRPSSGADAQIGNLEASKKNCSRPELLRRRHEYRLPVQRDRFDMLPLLMGTDDCPGRELPAGSYTPSAPYIDTGNTIEANSTVSQLCKPYYCYTFDPALGSDHVYTFRMTGFGPNPQIQVSSNSSTYRPLIYVIDSRYGSYCPSGTGNDVQHWQMLTRAHAPTPGGTALINNFGGLPMNTDLYLFIDGETNSASGAGPYTIRIQDIAIGSTASPAQAEFDFDNDGRADTSVFRPSERTWYIDQSTEGLATEQFGLADDRLVPADFDGDGKTDVAIYRDGAWWWLRSSDHTINAMDFGIASDLPVPADYSGDGRAELGVYRNGSWITFDLALQQSSVFQFGLATDKPVVGDYDNDGRMDQAVYRNGQWHLNRSLQGYAVINFGLASDRPVVGDYDGDGRTDQAVYRNGEWHINRTTLAYTVITFGLTSDVPVAADYDGDGRTDIAVYRNGTWFLLQSMGGFEVKHFGLPNDVPLPASFLPE